MAKLEEDEEDESKIYLSSAKAFPVELLALVTVLQMLILVFLCVINQLIDGVLL